MVPGMAEGTYDSLATEAAALTTPESSCHCLPTLILITEMIKVKTDLFQSPEDDFFLS